MSTAFSTPRVPPGVPGAPLVPDTKETGDAASARAIRAARPRHPRQGQDTLQSERGVPPLASDLPWGDRAGHPAPPPSRP